MDGTKETPVPADRFGEIAAHIAHFKGTRPAEIVERLGLSPPDFESAQRRWVGAVGSDLERDETALATVIGDAFARTRKRLSDEQPTVESLGPLKSELAAPAPAPEPVPAPVIEAEPPAPAVLEAPIPPIAAAPEIPSFLRADTVKPGYRPVESAPVMASPAVFPPPQVAPPLQVAPSPPVAAPAPPPAVRVTPSGIGGTAIGEDIQKIARQILPFGAPKPGAAPAPIKAPEAAARPPTPPVEHERPRLGGTAMAMDLPVPRREALPFAGDPKAPAGAPRPAEPPKLTMEQYASLHVDLQNPHADAAAVLRRYGLTPETKRTTDGWFSALFQRDPEKQASFHRACAAYKAWLASGSSPRKP